MVFMRSSILQRRFALVVGLHYSRTDSADDSDGANRSIGTELLSSKSKGFAFSRNEHKFRILALVRSD